MARDSDMTNLDLKKKNVMSVRGMGTSRSGRAKGEGGGGDYVYFICMYESRIMKSV
jgi:hypothetical protein